MADLDVSAAGHLFKLLAAQKLSADALKRKNPLVTWMKKDTSFTSPRGKEVSVEYTSAQGAGATFELAASTASAPKGDVFLVPQRRYVMNAGIKYDVLQNAAAGGSDSEFADAMINVLDGVTNQFGCHVERMAWGTSAGIRGTVATGTASPITLTNKTDAQLIEVGQSIQAISSSGTLRSGTGIVTGINRSTGAVTYSGTITGIAPTDVIVGAGDGGAFASPAREYALDGVQGWCPETPVADFLSVDQTVDRERLAGIFYDGSTMGVRTAFINAHAISDTMAGLAMDESSPSFLHPLNYAMLEQSIEASKITALDLKSKYGIGLEGISIGSSNFVKAPFAPINRSFKIGKDALVLGTSGDQPHLVKFNADGSAYTFDSGTGTLKFNMAMLGNVYSPRPYHLMHVKLNPQTVL